MKYAHIEKNTNKLLGWYDDKIHTTIPSPNVEVTEEAWQKAININANAYENNEFIAKDFRTEDEISEWENTKYQRTRALEYPSIQEQLDMQYWDKVNGTSNWSELIASIKEKYPKPNMV